MKILTFQFLGIFLALLCCSNVLSRHLFKKRTQSKHHIDIINEPIAHHFDHIHGHHHPHHHHNHHHHVNAVTIGGELTNIAPSATRVITPTLGSYIFYDSSQTSLYAPSSSSRTFTF